MTRAPRIAAQGDRRSTANRALAERQNRPQGLRPGIARIVEALPGRQRATNIAGWKPLPVQKPEALRDDRPRRHIRAVFE